MSFFSDIIGAAKGAGSFVVHGMSDAQQWTSDVLTKIPGASRVMQASNMPYTDIISRPLSTVVGFADEEDYKESTGQSAPISDIFSGGDWKKAWDNSANMSPGQAVVIGLNSAMWGNGSGQSNINYSLSHLPDPYDLSARDTFFKNNSAANLLSGAFDLSFRAGDPVGLLSRHVVNPAVKDALARPIKSSGLIKTSVDDVMNRPSTQAFLKTVPGKSFTELTQDPRFSKSAGGFKAAALMSAAKSVPEAAALYRIGLGDINAYHDLVTTSDSMAQATSELEDMRSSMPKEPDLETALGPNAGSISSIDDMIREMSEHNASLTLDRVNAIINPIDMGMNGALSPLEPLELEQVRGMASQQIVEHALNMLREGQEDLDNVKEMAGKLNTRTTGSILPDRYIAARAKASIANAKGGSPFSWSIYKPEKLQALAQHAVMDPLVRVYQATKDVSPGKMVEFGEDDSVGVVRAMLNTFSSIEPDEEDRLLREYAAAGKTSRPEVFDRIESRAIESMAAKYGVDADQAKAIHNEYNYRRNAVMENIKSNAYGVLAGSKYGSKFKPLGDSDSANATVMPAESDSEVLLDPYLANQLQRGALPAIDGRDLNTALKRMTENGTIRHVLNKGHAGNEFLKDQLDRTYGLWKGLTLLTGHRAYNHIGDDFGRTLAKVGALAVSKNAKAGMGNLIRNNIDRLTADRQIRNLSAEYDKQVALLHSAADARATRFASQQEYAAKGIKMMPGHQLTQKDVDVARKAYEDLKKQGAPKALVKHRVGDQAFKVPGTNIELEGLFGGRDAEALRNLFSSDDTFEDIFMEENSALYESIRSDIGHDVITPKDGAKVHGNAIIRFVRNQLGPDPVFRKMAAGMGENDIRNWLENTGEGRARLRDLHTTAADNIQNVRDAATRFLPSAESIQAAAHGKYTAKYLESDFPTAAMRPNVHGSVALLKGLDNPANKYIKDITSKLIRLTGSLPDDILVRHPLAATMYKSSMIDSVKNVQDQLGEHYKLTPDDLEHLRGNAIEQTRHDMQHLLYDTSQFHQIGNVLRFVMPFYNAWYSAISNWSKLVLENPQLILRTYQAKRALWGSPAAIDATTGLPADQSTSMDDLAFLMHLPSGLAKSLGMGDMNYIPVDAATLISPTYMDSMGSPGWGPLVAVPVNAIAKANPQLADNAFVQQVLGGYIDSNSLEKLLPSATTQLIGLGQDAGVLGNPQDNASKASMMWSLYQEQMYDYTNGQRAQKPTWSDISKQADWLWSMSALVNRLMPLGFKPEKNHQFLADQYQSLVDANPQTADQDFYDKYGSSGFIFSQSLSANPGGIPATSGALKLIAQNKGLLQQYPELASVLFGADQAGQPFDEGAYQYEKATGLRTYLSPQDAASQEQQNLGWTQYNMLMDNINAQLAERGLVSTKQTGASDLQTLKDSFISATADPTSQFYNPDFYSAYGGINQNSYQMRIQSMEQLAMNPGLLSNPLRSDIKSLNTYFQLRDQAQAYLGDRKYKSLTDKSNTDIANWFDYNVGILVQSDTKFGALYNKFLKNDDLTTP